MNANQHPISLPSAMPPMEERRASLHKQFNMRPTRQTLKNKNIIKRNKTEPLVTDMMQKVYRAQVQGQLSKRLGARSSIRELFSNNIIQDSNEYREKVRDLKSSSLNQFLLQRPKVTELIKSKVLEDTMTWSSVKQVGMVPDPRNCHASSMIDGMLYVFGGYGLNEQKLSTSLFDTSSNNWSHVVTAGEQPYARYSASCVKIGKNIILFGGYSYEGYWMNDLRVLDTNYVEGATYIPSLGSGLENSGLGTPKSFISHMWYEPETSGPVPSPRAAHSCTVVGRKLFIFGGNNHNTLFGDLYVLDTETFKWSMPPCKGTPPFPRSGHSAVLLKHKLVIFGGGGTGKPMNDVHYLDLKTMTWVQPEISGTAPFPRAGHSACEVEANSILIFGGGYSDHVYNDIHLLNMNRLTWSRPADTGNVPCPRTGHSMDATNGIIHVFGGCDSQGQMYNDLYMLDAEFYRLSHLVSLQQLAESPHISPQKNSPVDIIDLLQENLTDQDEEFLCQTLDGTTQHVAGMLKEMEEKIKLKQKNMMFEQTQLIAYVKNYHKRYEDEMEDMRNDVHTLKKVVVTELSHLKARLVGFLSAKSLSPRLEDQLQKLAPRQQSYTNNIDGPETSLHRKLTQPRIPGAPPKRQTPRTGPVGAAFVESKKSKLNVNAKDFSLEPEEKETDLNFELSAAPKGAAVQLAAKTNESAPGFAGELNGQLASANFFDPELATPPTKAGDPKPAASAVTFGSEQKKFISQRSPNQGIENSDEKESEEPRQPKPSELLAILMKADNQNTDNKKKKRRKKKKKRKTDTQNGPKDSRSNPSNNKSYHQHPV